MNLTDEDKDNPINEISRIVARVKAMRDHLGEGFPLMADANMKWTVEEAIKAAKSFPAL